MKVLFISSGNIKNFEISPIIKNQGESLKEQGVIIEYYRIKGKGLKGYLSNVIPLRKKLKAKTYDVVHAHYSLSAFVASLAGAKPLVVSLMGSDVKAKSFFKIWIKLFVKLVWSAAIVKSQDMKESLGLQKVNVIPNGVNFNRFKPLDKKDCQEQLGWNNTKINVLFAANPERLEKNYKLAKEAISTIDDTNIVVHFLKGVPNTDMPLYYNAADVVLLTSLWEGSPNVIKEAMACNRPIVATNVGDIAEVVSKTKGCYVTSFDKYELAEKLSLALTSNDTTGRKDIEYLNANKIACRIIDIYDNVINK